MGPRLGQERQHFQEVRPSLSPGDSLGDRRSIGAEKAVTALGLAHLTALDLPPSELIRVAARGEEALAAREAAIAARRAE